MKLWLLSILLALTVPVILMTAKEEVPWMETVTLSSPAFKHGEPIPARYTCDGADTSTPLAIGTIPPATRMLALIMEDPDAPAGNWVHWVVWNIPTQTREIPENSLPAGTHQGMNDWKRKNYGGPCPPSGTHRYYFRLYAVDTSLLLTSETTKSGLLRAMEGHIVAKGELMGTYRRR